MPLTDADITKIVNAVWLTDGILTGVTAPPRDPKNPSWAVKTGLTQLINDVTRLRVAVAALGNPQTVAAAVVAALPPSAEGGITPAQVESAVTDALSALSLVTTVQTPS